MTHNFPGPVIGVGVLIWREKQLLLGQRITKGQETCWQFPGGHLENSESVIECARREVLEETGLKITSPRHLGFTNKPCDIGQRQYITLLVSCDYESGEAQRLEPEKCGGWEWFDFQALPAPLFSPITNFISQHVVSEQAISKRINLYELHNASCVISDAPANTSK
jgi:8-oxo-dGTP diphosphatase